MNGTELVMMERKKEQKNSISVIVNKAILRESSSQWRERFVEEVIFKL